MFNFTEKLIESTLHKSLVKGTLRKYLPAHGQWMEFLRFRNYTHNKYLDNISLMDKRKIFTLFMNWLHTEKEVNPSNVMTGLRHSFLTACADTDIFKDPTIISARNSFGLSGRERSKNKEKKYRYPISYDMIIWLRYDCYKQNDIDKIMTYLGIAMAFNFLLRASEYAWDSDTKGAHSILNEDVKFETTDGARLSTREVADPLNKNRTYNFMIFINRSHKGNSKGRGRIVMLKRETQEESLLLDDVIAFNKKKNAHVDTDLFFSRIANNRLKKLIRNMISVALKSVAIEFDLPPEHFSSHCARIAGATVLEHAGHSDSIIKKIGNWSSDVSLMYPDTTSATTGVLNIIDSKQKHLSVDDVRRLKPFTSIR